MTREPDDKETGRTHTSDAMAPTHTSDALAETATPSPPFGGSGSGSGSGSGAGDMATAAPSAFRTVDDADYDVLGDIARGGMGRIRHARDRRHGRPVAIKELLKSSTEARQRFHREALITARLQHPAIVPLYEAGTWPNGEPFYAMKLVEGEPLDKVIARRPTLAERVSLLPRVTTVAEAIAYAHDRRIIHRDLKPSNILVGDLGETVVIDWGLAKELGERDVPSTSVSDGATASGSGDALTVAGRTMGTPAYMPPEQARGGDVDERADVYALGAVLYHLLTGKPPYSDAKGVNELLERLRAGPPPALATLVPEAPRDLVTIVEKAMARAPGARYPRARELAADLRRFEAGQLVGAHAYSTREILGRWVRRHRGVVAVIVIAAVLAAIGATISFRRVARERDTARRFARASEVARREADDRVEQLSLDRARVLLPTDPSGALALARAVPPTSRWSALAALTARVAEAWGIATELWRGDGLGELAVTADGTRMAWSAGKTVYVRGADGAIAQQELAAAATALALSPDGAMLAAGTGTGDVYYGAVGSAPARLGSLDETIATIDLGHAGIVAVAGEDSAGWWDLAASPPTLVRAGAIDETPSRGGVGARDDRVLIVRPTGTIDVGSRLAARSRLSLATYWNSWTRQPGEVTPDGDHLLFLSDKRELALLDLATGARRAIGTFELRTVAVWVGTVDGLYVVVDILGGVHVWSPDGGSRDPVTTSRTSTNALAVCRLGTRLAIGFEDGDIWIVDPRRGLERTLKGHVGNIFAVAAVERDGLLSLVSAGRDGTVRRWTIDSPDVVTTSVGFRAVTAVAVTRGGTVAAAGEDGVVQVWDVGARPAPVARGVLVNELVLSPDERYLVWSHTRRETVGGTGLVELSDRAHPSLLVGCSSRAVFAARAPRFACERVSDGAIVIWDTRTWTSSGIAFQGPPQVDSLAISADGDQIATGGMVYEFALRWWDRTSDRRVTLASKKGNQWDLAFRDDGTLLAIDGARQLVAWQPAQERSATLGSEAAAVRHLVASEHLVATGAEDGTIAIWDLERRRMRRVRALVTEDSAVESIQLSAREDVIVARYQSGRVVLWDIASGAGVPLSGVFRSIALSSDGHHLVAGRNDGIVLRLALPATTRTIGDEGWEPFALDWKSMTPTVDAEATETEKSLAAAAKEPDDGATQRRAGDHLRRVGRLDEAHAYYLRAAALGDGPAAWRLAAERAAAAPPADRERVLVEESLRIALASPKGETQHAFKWVMTSPQATTAQKTALLERWMTAAGDDVERLNSLAYEALGGGALDMAERIVTRLVALNDDAPYLDTAAEVAHMRGDRARAIALSERAIAKVPTDQELRTNLRRFHRGNAEPALTLVERLPPPAWTEAPARIPLPPP
ncbi:MAG TPA: WD40 repeat domain-containing serine/threonine protein kinase [Kofleriaceae bacterium]|nr:WD40 repeat domain-containing serine/threonine protein kinase [Kofleriaceae bacterium]